MPSHAHCHRHFLQACHLKNRCQSAIPTLVIFKIDERLPSPPRVSFDGVTILDDVTDGVTDGATDSVTDGPTRTPSATFNSPLPLPFSGATSACSSDAHCGEQAHAVEVHTLVGYPEVEPNG